MNLTKLTREIEIAENQLQFFKLTLQNWDWTTNGEDTKQAIEQAELEIMYQEKHLDDLYQKLDEITGEHIHT